MVNNSLTICTRFIVPALVLMGILFSTLAAAPADATTCGRPDYDRSKDRGIYVWQNCGTGQWFFRVSSGGRPPSDEFRVEGRLQLDKPFASLNPFSLDSGLNGSQDLFETPDPETADFIFRVWVDAQDGFDFGLTNGTTACLKVNAPDDMPIVIGKDNITANSPVNLETLDPINCASTNPGLLLLL